MQTSPLGQPVEPVRQPGAHRWLWKSQIRPLLRLPQSPSLWQPQVPLARQLAPLPPLVQAACEALVHSTQIARTGSQIGFDPPQSVLVRQPTHTPPPPSTGPPAPPPLQSGRLGMLAQSTSKSQPTVQLPAVALFEVQKRSGGQLLRPGARAQPSTHRRVTPSQIRPEVAEPQSASTAQPQNTPEDPVSQAWPSGLLAHAAASPPAPVVHSTHPPVPGLQAGVSEKRLHSALDEQPAQVPFAHTGALAEQSAAVRH